MNSRLKEITAILPSWLNETSPGDPGWGPSDWPLLKMVARVHGVGPLLHRQLGRVSWLPGEMRLWLAEQYRYNRDRAARFRGDLQAVLSAFAAEAIAVMPLKGSLLFTEYYPDPALRPMADIDLLIRPADRLAAEAVLESLGYRRLSANWKHTEWGRPGNLEVVSREFEHPDNPRKLDLHVAVTEMIGGPTMDITGRLWQRAEPGCLLGEPAVLPHPDDLWLHLLLHANGEIWGLTNRLLHLYDLTLVPGPGALPSGDARFVYLALRQLQAYFPGSPHARLQFEGERSLAPGFIAWAGEFDLFNSSYLGRETAAPYLDRLRSFYGGRPIDLLPVLRFILLPQRDEVRYEAGNEAGLLRSAMAWVRVLEKKIALVTRLLDS